MVALADINEEWFDKKIEQLEGMVDCTQVEDFIKDAEKDLEEHIESLLKHLDQYEKWLKVLQAPGSLEEVITYISDLIAVLTDMVAPYVKAIETQIALAQKYIELFNAVTQKSVNLQCNLTLPTPPEVPELPTP